MFAIGAPWSEGATDVLYDIVEDYHGKNVGEIALAQATFSGQLRDARDLVTGMW